MTADAAASRLDRSVLRYVLLHDSRLNMLALERRMQALRGSDGLLRLEPGAVRSGNAYRIAVTLQLAAEIQLADPDVVNWIARDQDGLRRQMATDAAYFASDAWESGREDTAVIAVPDGLPLPRDRFFDYMQERTRLHEDRKPEFVLEETPRTGTEAEADVPAPANVGADAAMRLEGAAMIAPEREAALRYLRSVAAGVFAMLAPAYGLAEWRHAVLTRAPSVLRKPAPEVFDALLLGQRSLLTSFGRWRYAALNQRQVAPPMSGAQLAADSIERAHATLAEAFGTLDIDDVFSGELFAFLADEVRLLPTSPAASAVARAVTNHRQRFTESGGQLDPRQTDDDQLLQEFGDLLAHNEFILVHALACAAFLAELRGSEPAGEEAIGEKTRRSLRLLAAGLNFDDKSGEEILAALVKFEGTLAARSDRPNQKSTGPQVLPGDGLAQLGERMRHARSAGREVDHRLITFEAWTQAEERMRRFADTGIVVDAGAEELLSAASRQGPGRLLAIDPRHQSLQAWSEALLAALAQPDVPGWLAAFALRRLGADVVPAARRDALLQAAMAIRLKIPKSEQSPDDERATMRRAFGGARAGADGRARTVIVVRQEETHAFDGWRELPREAVVLLVTKEQAAVLATRLRPLVKTLPRPIRVEFEAPADNRTSGMIELLLTQAHGTGGLVDYGMRWLRGWLYPRPGREFQSDEIRSVQDLMSR